MRRSSRPSRVRRRLLKHLPLRPSQLALLRAPPPRMRFAHAGGGGPRVCNERKPGSESCPAFAFWVPCAITAALTGSRAVDDRPPLLGVGKRRIFNGSVASMARGQGSFVD